MTTAAGHAATRARKASASAIPEEPKGLLARAGEALSGKGALIGAVALGAAGLAAGVAAARAGGEKAKGKKAKK